MRKPVQIPKKRENDGWEADTEEPQSLFISPMRTYISRMGTGSIAGVAFSEKSGLKLLKNKRAGTMDTNEL